MGRHCARSSCPFCGWHYSDVKSQQQHGEAHWAQCCSCGARGPRMGSKREAIEGWQTLTVRLDRHGDQIPLQPHPSQLVPIIGAEDVELVPAEVAAA